MQEKECTKCGVVKPYSEFYKTKRNRNGLISACMKCSNKSTLAYSRTKHGLIISLYSHQKYGCNKRHHPMPTYSRQELEAWLFNQSLFHKLHDSWVKSGYLKLLRPSVDRKNDYKSYTLDNIQLMTWKQNKMKCFDDRKNGINNKTNKAVLQFDLEGNFIKEYYSTMQAERETGTCHSGITKVCNDMRKTAGGCNWEYKFKKAQLSSV